MDLLGMDVTWTAEFAEAGWIRELTGDQKAAGDQGHPRSRRSTRPPGRTSSTASRSTTNVQLLWYRKALVPTPPKTFDEMIAMAQQLKAQGKPYEIGFTAAQYEGYVVNINNLVTGVRRHARQRGQLGAHDRRQDRAGAHLLHRLATSGADQLVALQRPGARGLRGPAERAVGLLAQLAVRAQRHARGQPGPGRRPRLRAVPDGRRRRHAEGDARRDELRDQHLQQAPGRGVRRGHVHAQREERAQRRARRG